MYVIGLTGGIASGKSYVAQLLAARGAVILDADQHAQTLLDEPSVQQQLIARWGNAIITPAGKSNRKAIAKRIFGSDEPSLADRKFLEQLLHPQIRQRIHADLAQLKGQGTQVAVLDIPLLHESGYAKSCDQILFIDTPIEIRQTRATERGWNPDELAQREQAQLPIQKKRELAHSVISAENAEKTEDAVHDFWRQRFEETE